MENQKPGKGYRFCPSCDERVPVQLTKCLKCEFVLRNHEHARIGYQKATPWHDANNIAGARTLASVNAVKLTDNAPFARGSTLHAAYMIALAESILKEIRK